MTEPVIGEDARLSCVVRDAREADIAAVQAIYAHHVLHGTATFEEAAPSVGEMSLRRAAVLDRGLPYLVAYCDGRVVGYSYAALYRDRSGYRFTIEDSVYVDRAFVGAGVGRALLATLIGRCAGGPWREMIAVIGDSGNAASIALHASLGFRHAGLLQGVGFKFGRWIDSVLMQRELAR